MNLRLVALGAALAMQFAMTLSVRADAPVVRARTPVRLPDPPGYVTLKCDFHIHTVFSDGLVWPTVRVEEAWREGLDAIAITDHIEYHPHRVDVSTNHNRSYEIARGRGTELGILVIAGAEITRQMPPGHFNAIFLTNAAALAVDDWREAFAIARGQGAFLFWNHPGWERQLIEGQIRWFPEHTELLEADRFHGIEIVNGRDYWPEAHQWALDKNLALISNTDIHDPIHHDYHVHAGDRRPLTLVFARERSVEGIREALFARRTAVLAGGRLLGAERFVRPLVEGAVRILNPEVSVRPGGRVFLQIHNDSSLDLKWERAAEPADLTAPQRLTLAAQKTVLLELRARGRPEPGLRTVELPYRVRNVLTAPDQPLPMALTLEIRFEADRAR